MDIITQQEFAKTQQEYFEKNAKLFEDTEENKLEYTNIHTEYVYILDTVVEANLKEKYTSDQIDAFYLGFKDNLEEYKKINPEVVNTLFSFIDFEAFKKSGVIKYPTDWTDPDEGWLAFPSESYPK